MQLKRLSAILPIVLLLAMSLLSLAAAGQPAANAEARPGPGVSETVMLSDYFSGLAGTTGDTPVYILNGSKPGPTVLILGGTHGDEIAGAMTALLLVERARVECGRLIVIPRANNSASTNYRPGWTQCIELETPSGRRVFRYGSRLTHPRDEAIDPAKFGDDPGNMLYVNDKTRDLNRCYPGRADGNLTQRIAYGITQLICKERPGLAVDFHEGPYQEPGAHMIFTHPNCRPVADMAAVRMASQYGMFLPVEDRWLDPGMNIREWGNAKLLYIFGVESGHPDMANPISAERAVNDDVQPLWCRIGYHLTVMRAILEAFGEYTGASMSIMNLPSAADLKKNGPGPYFN